MSASLFGVLYLSYVLAGFYFGVIYLTDVIVNKLVLLQRDIYLFGVIAIFDKRLIGKQPYV